MRPFRSAGKAGLRRRVMDGFTPAVKRRERKGAIQRKRQAIYRPEGMWQNNAVCCDVCICVCMCGCVWLAVWIFCQSLWNWRCDNRAAYINCTVCLFSQSIDAQGLNRTEVRRVCVRVSFCREECRCLTCALCIWMIDLKDRPCVCWLLSHTHIRHVKLRSANSLQTC